MFYPALKEESEFTVEILRDDCILDQEITL